MTESSPTPGEGAADRRKHEFEAFYHENIDKLHAYVRSHSAAVDVDAISNEAMTRVYEKWDELTGPRRAWVFRVTHNLVLDDLRKQRPVSCEPENLPEVGPHRFAGPEASYELVEIGQAIAGLPKYLQAPILLAAQQVPPREIAIVLGMSPRTVSSYLYRARELLHEHGLSDAGSGVASEPRTEASDGTESPPDRAESPPDGAEQPRVSPGVDPHHGQED